MVHNMWFFTLNGGDLILRSVARDIRYSILLILESLKYMNKLLIIQVTSNEACLGYVVSLYQFQCSFGLVTCGEFVIGEGMWVNINLH